MKHNATDELRKCFRAKTSLACSYRHHRGYYDMINKKGAGFIAAQNAGFDRCYPDEVRDEIMDICDNS